MAFLSVAESSRVPIKLTNIVSADVLAIVVEFVLSDNDSFHSLSDNESFHAASFSMPEAALLLQWRIEFQLWRFH